MHLDALRLRAFPFSKEVTDFIDSHDRIFVVEQNRDGQMRKLLIIECDLNPKKLLSVVHYDGMPMTALGVSRHIAEILGKNNVTPLRKRKAGAKA